MSDTTPLETTPTPETPTTQTPTTQTPTTQPRRRRGVLRPVLIGVGSALAVLALGVGGFAIADELNDSDDDRVVVNSGDTTVPLGDDDDSASPRPSNSASSDDGGGRDVSDEDYARVSAAALEAVGGGTVTELKRDDDPGVAWEVEILLDNGDEADVELADDLSVVRVDLDRQD